MKKTPGIQIRYQALSIYFVAKKAYPPIATRLNEVTVKPFEVFSSS